MLLLLATLVLTVSCHPIQDGGVKMTTTAETIPAEIQADIKLVSYVRNFKNAMTDYVTSRYRNLTMRETDCVRNVLEDFLITFAKELHAALDRQDRNAQIKMEYEPIPDGVPDETFKNINDRLRSEFASVNDDTAKEIVYRLRKNLYETRNKLDIIIEDSELAQVEYA